MIQPVPSLVSVTNIAVVEHDTRLRSGTPSSSSVSPRLNASVLKGANQGVAQGDATKIAANNSPISSSQEDPQKINRLLEQVRDSLKQVDLRVELSLDSELNTVIVRVLDKETGDVKKQFPTEDLLQLKRFLNDHSGLFVEEEA